MLEYTGPNLLTQRHAVKSAPIKEKSPDLILFAVIAAFSYAAINLKTAL